MILVASDNPVVVDELSTLLRQKGDLFTVAADEALVLSALRADRATLLIADTGSSGFDGFSLCRTIRSDPALLGLPVLCIVAPADLGVLLAALDCRADAFLARPFDLESLSAAIGDLQDRQAGGAASGAVRTQFRINHEGREYTVVADRRQLLEFLISAFETAVRIQRDQDRMRSGFQDKIKGISERLVTLTAERDATVKNLHEELEERNRSVEKLGTALQAEEQAKALLKVQKENVSQELKELGAVLETTRRSDDEKGCMVAALTTDLAAAAAEKTRSDQEHAAGVLTLETRLKEAVAELDASRSREADLGVKTAGLERMLATVQEDYSREKEKEREVRSALDNLNSDLHALQQALEQNLRQLEQELSVRKDLQKQVETLTKERDILVQRDPGTGTRPAETESELAAERELRIQVQAECDAVTAEHERTQDVLEATFRELSDLKETYKGSMQFLDSASGDIGVLNAALEQEREKRAAAEARASTKEKECVEKEGLILALRAELETVQRTIPESGKRETPAGSGEQEDSQETAVPERAPAKLPPDTPAEEAGSVTMDTRAGSSEASAGTATEQTSNADLPRPASSYQMILPSPLPPLPLPESPGTAGFLQTPAGTAPVQESPPGQPAQIPAPSVQDTATPLQHPRKPVAVSDLAISRDRWLDITKWVHHTGTVTEEQRKDLIATLMRMSKLVQKGRHLTNRQEQEIRALVARLQSLGYRFV